MNSVKSRVGKGSIWITGTRASVNLLGLASTVILARLLAPTDFGLVALGATLLAIVTAITDFSMGQALVQHDAPTDEHMHTAWTLGALRGFFLGAIFAASGPLTSHIWHDERMTVVMAAFGLSIFLSGLANPRRILYQKNLIFWQDFVLQVSQNLVRVIVSIFIAYFYRSYWALILGTISGQIAVVLISYLTLPYFPRFSLVKFRELWSFSYWLTLSSVVNTINWRFDHLLVGRYLGSADLGYYTVGNNLAVIPTRESTYPLTNTLYPAFAQLSGKPDRLQSAYQRAQQLITAIALPLGVGTACVARPLVLLAMGAKWETAILIIEILASMFALQTLGSLAQPLGMAMGKTRMLFSRDVQMLFIRLPFVVGGMYFDGIRGLLIGRALSVFLGIYFQFRIVREILDISFKDQLKVNFRAIFSCICMAVIIVLVRKSLSFGFILSPLWEELIVCSVLGALTYVAITSLLWCANGCPAGAEAEIFGLLRRLLSRFLSGPTAETAPPKDQIETKEDQ